MHPYVAFIKNDLLSCQLFVGGSIEVLDLSETACLICNKEGKLLDLIANHKIFNDIICGRFIISGQNNEGDFISLNQKDINRYSSHNLNKPYLSKFLLYDKEELNELFNEYNIVYQNEYTAKTFISEELVDNHVIYKKLEIIKEDCK